MGGLDEGLGRNGAPAPSVDYIHTEEACIMQKYEALIGDKWVAVSSEKLLFLILPMGICKAYRTAYRGDSQDMTVTVNEFEGCPISIGEVQA